jgi:hypothetical protein
MHLGMSYTELRRLPVRYRTWYVKRLSKHFEDKKKAMENRSSNSQSSPDMSSLDKFEKMINQKI